MFFSVPKVKDLLISLRIKDSQVVHPLQALPSLLVHQKDHEGQHLPVFLRVQHHHVHPLVHLYQQDRQGQKHQGYPMMERQRILAGKKNTKWFQIQTSEFHFFQFVVDVILTLGPGDPTLPAAPGKPVAPCQWEREISKHTHNQPVIVEGRFIFSVMKAQQIFQQLNSHL